MKVDIYESEDKAGVFVVVESGSDISSLPEKVKPNLFKSISLNEGDNKIAISGTEALKDISEKGFHLINPEVKVSENI